VLADPDGSGHRGRGRIHRSDDNDAIVLSHQPIVDAPTQARHHPLQVIAAGPG
jgi:hypothetical protein